MTTVYKIVHKRPDGSLESCCINSNHPAFFSNRDTIEQYRRLYRDQDGTVHSVDDALAFRTKQNAIAFMALLNESWGGNRFCIMRSECTRTKSIKYVCDLLFHIPLWEWTTHTNRRKDAPKDAPKGTLLCQGLRVIKDVT